MKTVISRHATEEVGTTMTVTYLPEFTPDGKIARYTVTRQITRVHANGQVETGPTESLGTVAYVGVPVRRRWRDLARTHGNDPIAEKAQAAELARQEKLAALKQSALKGYQRNHGIGPDEIQKARAAVLAARPEMATETALDDVAINYAIVHSPRMLDNLRAGMRSFRSLKAKPRLAEQHLMGTERINDTIQDVDAQTAYVDIVGSLGAMREHGFRTEANDIAAKAVLALFP